MREIFTEYPSCKLYGKPFGAYQTNCYILQNSYGEIIIDPGMGADSWVKNICKNPLAILNTHGHFDHIWSNKALQETYINIPLIVHQDDAFMLQEDCFNMNLPLSCPTQLIIHSDQQVCFENFALTFKHFPGHTPGCCIIETDDFILSGDFIFYRSIGRYDFPYSSAWQMQESLQRFKQLGYDKTIYPGHGQSTSIAAEQMHIDFWLTKM